MINPNPNFIRPHRTTKEEARKEYAVLVEKFDKEQEQKANEEARKKQEAKEKRWSEHRSLGELTDRYIKEGLSEEDAYRWAKQDIY